MNILDRYVAKTVILGTALVLFILIALTAFFSFLGEVGRIGTGDYGLTDAIEYVLLSIPQQAWEMFPVAALIGTLVGLGGLASGSELVAMRAAGISLMQLARASVFGAVLLAIIALLLGDVVAPPAEQYAQYRRAVAAYGELSVAGGQGVWARDGRTFVNVRQLSDGQRIDGIYIFEFDDEGRLRRSAQAVAARYSADGWALENVEETVIDAEGVASTTSESVRRWDTELSPDLLNLFVVDPGSLSAVGLYRYVTYLNANGLDATRYQHAFWAKLVAPISVIVMVLLALPFVTGSQRSGGASRRLMLGLLIGVAFFMVNRVLGFSGAVFDLNPVVLAWLPTLVLATAALYALRRG